MSTRERILECALSRFNSDGLPAVGLRDIALELGMSPGNVTYYFARKEDLVLELANQLSALNDASLGPSGAFEEFGDMLTALGEGMNNHWRYRFMTAAYVQLMTQYPSVAKNYGAVELRRRKSLEAGLETLRARGAIRSGATPSDLEQTSHGIALIARFSCTDRHVRREAWKQTLKTEHYLALIARHLLSVATKKGERQLAPWLEGSPKAASPGR